MFIIGKIQTLRGRRYLSEVDNEESKPPIHLILQRYFTGFFFIYIQILRFIIITIIHTIYFWQLFEKSSLIFFFNFFFSPLSNISWTSLPFRYLILFGSCIFPYIIILLNHYPITRHLVCFLLSSFLFALANCFAVNIPHVHILCKCL